MKDKIYRIHFSLHVIILYRNRFFHFDRHFNMQYNNIFISKCTNNIVFFININIKRNIVYIYVYIGIFFICIVYFLTINLT